MQYEFLNQFTRRMKHVGRYAVLMRMTMNRQTLRQYGFETYDEQMNLLFAVLLYIMEQSLKDESCTVDDIGAYIDDLNSSYFRKAMGYEDSRAMADFIINVILSNDGVAMSFKGYDFDRKDYQDIPIAYVNNRVIYTDGGIKRTSYQLTDDGYDLVLSTLEIEDNLKLPVHEMIFELHLKKQSYDKAVTDIRNVFQMLQIQYRKIQDAMIRIRRNALSYSVEEYRGIMNENLDTLSETKEKFLSYRRMIHDKTREIEEKDIDYSDLSSENRKNLENLSLIDDYLGRALEEQQKIFGSHLDLKSLYTKELEQLSQMSAVRRFSYTADFYDRILKDPSCLDRVDLFLRPLFSRPAGKIYDPSRALAVQRTLKEREALEDEKLLIDDTPYDEGGMEQIRRKLSLYDESVAAILTEAINGREEKTDRGQASCITLKDLEEKCRDDQELKHRLIPDTYKFKEIMVELLNSREMDIGLLLKERRENIQEEARVFSLSSSILDFVEKITDRSIYLIEAMKIDDGSRAVFTGIADDDSGEVIRDICCSNVLIRVRWEDKDAV
ncbi:MAG: hypothetical protein SPL57_03470 [Lachnospiraceae bacterium]|nr:hypothetical protein [Lachnospiraceae bacterium]